jgi:hypothetical protein
VNPCHAEAESLLVRRLRGDLACPFAGRIRRSRGQNRQSLQDTVLLHGVASWLRNQAEIERTIPRDRRIGSFNAGIPLYFGTGRVVALDGLVSHAARGYWIERRLDEYLRDARVAFIADERWGLDRAQRFSRATLPLQERRTFPLHGWPTGERLLWAVEAVEDERIPP